MKRREFLKSAGVGAAAVAEARAATIARAIPPAAKAAMAAARKAVNPRCAHVKGVRFHGRLFLCPAQSSAALPVLRSLGKGGAKEDAHQKLHSFFNECPLTMIDFDALVISVN